jgi:enoyl-CoA hydratase/carnithine racemase
MLTDVLSYTVGDRKAYITMNRPKQMNALNRELLGALAEAFGAAEADDDVFVVILSGAGGRAFSAGGDLKEVATRLEAGGEIAGQDSGRPRRPMSAHPAVATSTTARSR